MTQQSTFWARDDTRSRLELQLKVNNRARQVSINPPVQVLLPLEPGDSSARSVSCLDRSMFLLV